MKWERIASKNQMLPPCWICGTMRVFQDGMNYMAWRGDCYVGFRHGLRAAQNLAAKG